MESDRGRIYYGVGLDNSQLQSDAAESKRILQGVGKTAVKEGDEIGASFRKIGAAAAGIFAAAKLKDFAMQVVTVRGEFQKLEIAFKTMLGSADKADDLMSQLIHTAATTPFGMTEVATAAKQLLAYGVEADKVNETLIRLGDIASGLSIPIGDLAYLYGTTMTQGRLYTQDLRQFMGRGIPLAEELAKQFGVTKDAVGELVTAGKVGFPEVEQAIISLSGEGSKFGGLMEAQSKTISGQISNIEDAIEQMFNALGKSSEGVIANTLGVVSSLVENWQTVGKVILTVVATYGAYKGAVLAVAAAHKLQNIWGTVSAFLSLTKEVKSAKDMMLLFNLACKANPLGLILGIVAAAATAFSLFSKSESEATEMTTKFGDKAATAITRVNTLSTTLKGLTGGTSVHKKVMGELNGILEDYGVQALKEGDSIDTVNKKREQAIELIKQEAIERQRANSLEQGAMDYNNALNDAQSKLSSSLKSAMTEGILLTGNKEIQDNSAAISTIVASIVEQNITDIAGKTGDEYQKGIEKIYATIQERMRVIGISESSISKQWMTDNLFNHTNIIDNYITAVQAAKEANNRYSTAVNKAADAEKEAADNSMTFGEKLSAIEQGLQKPNEDVHKLYENIKSLMSQYSENTIGFNIKIGGEVPKWMESMDIPELQRLAKRFTALGQTAKSGANVNGKFFTQQQLLQRGADYATAADQKQTKNEKKEKEDAAAKKKYEKTRKRREAAAKKATEKIADETADRNKQIADYGKEVEYQQKQTELEIRQQKINLLEDGYTKTKQQIKLNYDRLIADNDKRRQDMLDDLADNQVLDWKNANPKATKSEELAYRASLSLKVEDLTSEQQGQLKSYYNLAEQIRQKANKDALDSMLAEVLSYEQQRTKIAEEYEQKRKQLYETDDKGNYVLDDNGGKKLRSGVSQDNVNELDKQETDALNVIDEQFAQREETYQAWCNEIANLTLEQLEAVLSEAEEELKKAQGNGASGAKLATARAKVTKAQQGVSKAKAQADVSPKKRSIKEWEDLYKTLQECSREFENIGDTVGGTAGEIIKTAGQIATSSLSMINGIVQLVQTSSSAMTATAATAATAIGTVEKASVILTVISAALQIAMTIANLFNSDEEKQKEIEGLQTRIDQLQWELDNADIVRLQQNSGKAIDRVRQALSEVYQEMLKQKVALYGTNAAWTMMSANVFNNNELLMKSADKVAKAYANIAYTADKALGNEKYASSEETLKNIAQQQLLINQQIKDKNKEKKPDHKQIDEWEKKIEELGAQAIAVINDMVEDIIGGTSSEIANELADAFFEAFEAGEDAAEAWGTKVNEIVADVLKRMMVTKFLEEPLGQIFDKYKSKWFKGAQFMGLDAVIESMSGFANDLNAVGEDFEAIWSELPESVKNMFTTTDAAREATEKGIATASQESVDELNGRMTAVQGHTYSISENTKILVATSSLILKSVINIEANTDELPTRMAAVDSNVKEVKDTVNDIALRGIKIK